MANPRIWNREDLNTWRGPNRSCHNLAFHYSVYADIDGPFDSILDGDHSFLNLAMVLFYLPRERQRPVQVKYPASRRLEAWRPSWKAKAMSFAAANYDALVDSPVEAGHFEEFSYPQDFIPPGAPRRKRSTRPFA